MCHLAPYSLIDFQRRLGRMQYLGRSKKTSNKQKEYCQETPENLHRTKHSHIAEGTTIRRKKKTFRKSARHVRPSAGCARLARAVRPI